MRVGIGIPKDYDENKPYPAIIALPYGNGGTYCHWMPWGELNEDFLCFDVTGRGKTWLIFD